MKAFALIWFLSICIISIITNNNVQAWTFSANFEDIGVGSVAEGSSGLTLASEEGSTCNTVSDIHFYGGSKSMKTFFVEGDTGSPGSSLATGGHIRFQNRVAEGDEIWGRFYVFIPAGEFWSWRCSPVVKVFRLAHVYSGVGTHVGYISIFSDANGQILLSNEVNTEINNERGTGGCVIRS